MEIRSLMAGIFWLLSRFDSYDLLLCRVDRELDLVARLQSGQKGIGLNVIAHAHGHGFHEPFDLLMTHDDLGFVENVLARIGTDLLEAALAEVEAELQHAESEFNKTTELFSRQAVPRQDLTSATSNYRRAEAKVKLARLRVERSIIRAPLSGVAIVREIEMGEVVPAGSLVTTIHQLSKLKGVVGIPEDDISYFKVGAEADVEADAYPERKFKSKIHFLSPAATAKNRSFPAEVAIDNRDGELRPGMIVRVRLVKQIYEDVIVIPRDAILERDSGNVAFVLKGDKAELRSVKTGPSEKGEIVVLEGLEPGDELIVTGHRNLVDGQRVRSVANNL